MKNHLIAVGCALAGLAGLTASPVLAQDATASVVAEADGWDVEIDAARKITLASIRYDSGAGLIIQCRDGDLSTIILGLPATAAPITPQNGVTTRRLETGALDELAPMTWRSAPDGTSAVRGGNVRSIRDLKKGGRFIVRTVAAENDPARAMVFDLPSDPSGLDQVLTACGRPLSDPRDALRDVSAFVTVDRQHFGLDIGTPPANGGLTYEYSCIVAPRGRVTDCMIELMRPASPELEARLLRSAPRARFDFGDDPDSLVGGIFYTGMTLVSRTERQ